VINLHTHTHTVFALEGLVDEVGRRCEVLAEVKVLGVLGRDAPVHTAAAVEVLVPDAALLGVGRVQDVRDAHFTQRAPVLSDSPGRDV